MNKMLVLPNLNTREEIISKMEDFPLLAVLPETPEQEQAVREIREVYQSLSLWLQYRLLNRKNLYFAVISQPHIQNKPYADFAVAGWDFCFQVFIRHDGGLSSPDELWGICEYSLSKNRLRSTGYFGGKTKGKDETYRDNKNAIRAFEVYSEGGEVERVKDYDPSEHWYEMVLQWAFKYSLEHSDKDLDYHARRFLSAWRHCNDITRRSSNELIKVKLPKAKRSRAKKTM